MLEPYSWGRLIRKSLYVIYPPFVLLGFISGQWAYSLLVATVLHLIWLYYYQKKLADWLWKDRSLVPPQGPGTWEYIFNGIYRLQQRHRIRRRELASVIRRFREGAEALHLGEGVVVGAGVEPGVGRLDQHRVARALGAEVQRIAATGVVHIDMTAIQKQSLTLFCVAQ